LTTPGLIYGEETETQAIIVAYGVDGRVLNLKTVNYWDEYDSPVEEPNRLDVDFDFEGASKVKVMYWAIVDDYDGDTHAAIQTLKPTIPAFVFNKTDGDWTLAE
jgi:hypothetical protein